LLFCSIYQHFTFCQRLPVLPVFFVVNKDAVQYRSNVKWHHLIWATLLNGAKGCNCKGCFAYYRPNLSLVRHISTSAVLHSAVLHHTVGHFNFWLSLKL